jgi:hypothetical protein
MSSPNENSPTPTRSVLHRAVYGSCVVVAGLFLVCSVLVLIAYIVAAVYFFSGFAD